MNDKEILKILKESPFILSKLFGNNLLKNQVDYDNKYFWGAITDDELNKVIAWLNEEEETTDIKGFEALDYFCSWYKEFLKGKDTHCQITLNREQATEFIKELEDAVIIPKATLEHWFELLCVNGCNSKGMVRNDIQEVLKKK